MKQLLTTIQKEIKFGVVFIDVLMTLYVLWLIITNTSTWIIGVLFGFTPFGVLELFRANELFGLCKIHKAMLIHTTAVYFCCVYQAQWGFGWQLPYMRWLMFLWGVLLIVVLIIKRYVKTIHN